MTENGSLVRRAALGAAVLVAGLLAGCVAAPEKEAAPQPELVFPPPPDPARFVFERIVFASSNLTVDDGTERFRRMVTGQKTSGRGFSKPFDVAACRGRVYVTDTVERSVMVYDVPARKFSEFGNQDLGTLRQPLGINVDDQCNVYVADGTAGRVKIYDAAGRFLREIGGDGDFSRLSHVAPSPDGTRVYAVDTGGVDTDQHRVRVYEVATGKHLFDFGRRGNGDGEFNLPRDIEYTKNGLVYVVDGANFRVQVFDPQGKFLRAFGGVGRQLGQFSRPKGIAIDGAGRIYVTDTAFGNFQIFSPEGELLLFIGTRGAQFEPAKYMLPAGIDVDEDGRVLMVDQYFRKVDIYRPVEVPAEAGFLGPWNKSPAA